MKFDWNRIMALAGLVADGVIGRTEMQDGVRMGVVNVGRHDHKRILRIDIELNDEGPVETDDTQAPLPLTNSDVG